MIMDIAYIVMAIMCVLICGDTNAHLIKPALPAQTDGSSRIARVRGRVAHKSDLLKPPPVPVEPGF